MGKEKVVEFVAYDMDEKRERKVVVRESDIVKSYRGRYGGSLSVSQGKYSNDRSLGMSRLKTIIKLCNEFRALPVIRTTFDGKKMIYLPNEVAREKNVMYTVFVL